MQLRKNGGLNQTVLAARLGITQSEVSKYERGERGLHDARLRAWLAVLGVPIEAFDAALEPQIDHCRFAPATLAG